MTVTGVLLVWSENVTFEHVSELLMVCCGRSVQTLPYLVGLAVTDKPAAARISIVAVANPHLHAMLMSITAVGLNDGMMGVCMYWHLGSSKSTARHTGTGAGILRFFGNLSRFSRSYLF